MNVVFINAAICLNHVSATASKNKKNVMYSTMRGSTKAGDLDGGNSIVIITIITKYFFVIHL